ncbi:hypothetical protein [Aeromonas veronii]|uniref:hypothetical protein n=1 Tax=Aeromonas veronii TaxID=654 RepID=UPI00191FF411|nr:hypothetical protein [Aeromonas veronii]MBL0489578.1 hypothetical protein [Aeromonas veronii]
MKKINLISDADIAKFEANGEKIIPAETPCCRHSFRFAASSVETGHPDRFECPFCGLPFTLCVGNDSSITC